MKRIHTFLKKLIPILLPCTSVIFLAILFMLVIWPQLGPILSAGSLFIASDNPSDTSTDSEHKEGFNEDTDFGDLPYIIPDEEQLPQPDVTPDVQPDGPVGEEQPDQGGENADGQGNQGNQDGSQSNGSSDKENSGGSSGSDTDKKKGYKQELGLVQHPATYILSENVSYPSYNEYYAKIDIYGRDVKVFFSDGKSALSKGAGQYMGSMPPGFGRPILLGGHNNSYFKNLKKFIVGDVITVTTNYGVYYYKVYATKIALRDDRAATHLESNKEELILYTCYPFTTLRLTKKRYFVYAEKIAGPTVIDSLDEIPSSNNTTDSQQSAPTQSEPNAE